MPMHLTAFLTFILLPPRTDLGYVPIIASSDRDVKRSAVFRHFPLHFDMGYGILEVTIAPGHRGEEDAK